jgi:hypothetical protein
VSGVKTSGGQSTPFAAITALAGKRPDSSGPGGKALNRLIDAVLELVESHRALRQETGQESLELRARMHELDRRLAKLEKRLGTLEGSARSEPERQASADPVHAKSRR